MAKSIKKGGKKIKDFKRFLLQSDRFSFCVRYRYPHHDRHFEHLLLIVHNHYTMGQKQEKTGIN
jgi:hypothetical protein